MEDFSELDLAVTTYSSYIIEDNRKHLQYPEVMGWLMKLSAAEKILLNEEIIVMKLLLIMPATAASRKGSISDPHQFKSYLRATLSQKKIIIMILHFHKELTDSHNPSAKSVMNLS